MTAQQVAADLRAAAEVLRRDGWCQRAWRDENDCRCAGGAVTAAILGRLPNDVGDEFDLAFDAAMNAWHAATRTSIILWNDEPGRTADEVIAALEAAAAAAEAQQ